MPLKPNIMFQELNEMLQKLPQNSKDNDGQLQELWHGSYGWNTTEELNNMYKGADSEKFHPHDVNSFQT